MIENWISFDEVGSWSSILSLILTLAAWIAGTIYFIVPSRRVKDLNITLFSKSDDDQVFPVRLHILIRNLTQNSVILSSPYIRLKDRKIASDFADGNSSTSEFELKFSGENNKLSEGLTLLTSGKDTTTILPMSSARNIDKIALASRKKLGEFYCTVTILKRKPSVRRLKVPLVNIQNRSQLPDSEISEGAQENP